MSLHKIITERGSKEHMMNLPHVRHVKSNSVVGTLSGTTVVVLFSKISREKLDSWRLLLLGFLSVNMNSLQEPWPINRMATGCQLTLGFMSDALRFLFHTGGICITNRGNCTCDPKQKNVRQVVMIREEQ